ncbi:MAG: nucleotidyltransferase domain-containing protein [Desulfobacterota bacterium]|nr:nucleotidyltransferase domain-containing protein [Thermodesulfobacteriota bacterium]
MKNLENLTLKTREKAAIKDATALLKERFSVQEVILFGSKARGDSDRDSDIDLLLLTNQSLHWRQRHAIVDALFDIEMKHDVMISIVVNTVNDWRHGVCTELPIHEEISREGVTIQ